MDIAGCTSISDTAVEKCYQVTFLNTLYPPVGLEHTSATFVVLGDKDGLNGDPSPGHLSESCLTISQVIMAFVHQATLDTVEAMLQAEWCTTAIADHRKLRRFLVVSDCQLITKLGSRHVVSIGL